MRRLRFAERRADQHSAAGALCRAGAAEVPAEGAGQAQKLSSLRWKAGAGGAGACALRNAVGQGYMLWIALSFARILRGAVGLARWRHVLGSRHYAGRQVSG